MFKQRHSLTMRVEWCILVYEGKLNTVPTKLLFIADQLHETFKSPIAFYNCNNCFNWWAAMVDQPLVGEENIMADAIFDFKFKGHFKCHSGKQRP